LSGETLYLAVESSTSAGSAAVGSASGVLSEVMVRVQGGHSSALLPAADYALRAAGCEARDLGAVVVGSGPGSFTGLRIAGATAKGIVHALGVPMFAFSSLLVTAAQAWAWPGTVCAVVDARGRNVYSASYRFGPRVAVVDNPHASTIDDVINRFTEADPPLFVGDGATRHRDELIDRLGATVAAAHLGQPRAGTLIWLASKFEEMGRVTDPGAWEPAYLRPSGAERIAAARSTGDGE